MEPDWLKWARRARALAQNGLAYTQGPFDRERYAELLRISTEMLAEYGGREPERVLELFAGEVGYATPKVDVRAAVFRGGELLLVRERADGLWALPGGWADVGESPAECVEREVREESGFAVRASKLLAVWDGRGHGQPARPVSVYKLCFRCEITDAGAAGSTETMETAEVGFFAEDRVPPLSLSRTTPSQAARLFGHLRHPEWPTDFD